MASFQEIKQKKSQLTQPQAFDLIRSWSKLIGITFYYNGTSP